MLDEDVDSPATVFCNSRQNESVAEVPVARAAKPLI
jgi:hypothetical protein